VVFSLQGMLLSCSMLVMSCLVAVICLIGISVAVGLTRIFVIEESG
jgi:hypothetical protein